MLQYPAEIQALHISATGCRSRYATRQSPWRWVRPLKALLAFLLHCRPWAGKIVQISQCKIGSYHLDNYIDNYICLFDKKEKELIIVSSLHSVSVFQCMSATPASKWTIMLGVVLPAPRPLEEETKPSIPCFGWDWSRQTCSQSLTGKFWSPSPSPAPGTVAGGAVYLSNSNRGVLKRAQQGGSLDPYFQYEYCSWKRSLLTMTWVYFSACRPRRRPKGTIMLGVVLPGAQHPAGRPDTPEEGKKPSELFKGEMVSLHLRWSSMDGMEMSHWKGDPKFKMASGDNPKM